MSNEVRWSNSYQFSSNGLSLNGSNNSTYSISGTNAIGLVQVIASGASEALTFTDLADVRYVYLKNQNEAGTVTLSTNKTQTQIFGVLGPGESMCYRPWSSNIYASGSGAAIDLQVIANET